MEGLTGLVASWGLTGAKRPLTPKINLGCGTTVRFPRFGGCDILKSDFGLAFIVAWQNLGARVHKIIEC
jgi:hypothetical protein